MAAVKAALKSMTATAVGTGVQVTYGDPGAMSRTELVYIGAAVDNLHDPVSLRAGKRQRDEDYTVTIVVGVGSQSTPELSESRAVTLGTAIEDAIAADPKLNDTTNVLWAAVSGMNLNTSESTEKPYTTLAIEVRVRARIL